MRPRALCLLASQHRPAPGPPCLLHLLSAPRPDGRGIHPPKISTPSASGVRLWAVARAAQHHAEHQEPGGHARVDRARWVCALAVWVLAFAAAGATACLRYHRRQAWPAGGRVAWAAAACRGARGRPLTATHRPSGPPAEVLRSQPYNEKCDVYSYGAQGQGTLGHQQRSFVNHCQPAAWLFLRHGLDLTPPRLCAAHAQA